MKYETMLDLETLGTGAGCCILQIGAVAFDPLSNHIQGAFSVYVNEIDGEVDPGTFKWWLEQKEDAQRDLVGGMNNGFNMRECLVRLVGFMQENNATNGVWSHGATFDIPILKEAAKRHGLVMPWKFWSEYDTRTLYRIKGKPTITREGVYHNALHDAIFQVKCVQEVMAR